MGRSLAIGGAEAFAGVVPGWGIGRGRDSLGPAVTHSAIHVLAAILAPVLLSLVAQAHSSEKIGTVLHRSTASLCCA
jgi:hypothetical protein